MSKDLVFKGRWNIRISISLVEVSMMHTMMVAEGDARRNDMCYIAQQQEKSVQGGRRKGQIMSEVMNEHPLSMAYKCTNKVCQYNHGGQAQLLCIPRKKCQQGHCDQHMHSSESIRAEECLHFRMSLDDLLASSPVWLKVVHPHIVGWNGRRRRHVL